MNLRRLVFLWVFLCAAKTGFGVEVPLDVLFRKDGAITAGRVSGVETLFLKMNVQLAEDQPKATISVPLVDIDHVDFGEEEITATYLEKVRPSDVYEVRNYWKQRESLLDIPESTAGAFGLKLATFLLASPVEADRQRALELFQRLEQKDWSKDRRALARQGRLQALVRLGRPAEAVWEAREVAKETDDPRVLIEADYVLAEAGMQQWRALQKEHPRWDQDDEVRPERERLYNEVLDLYLFPYLFHGSLAPQAARGLWGAVQAYRFAGEEKRALERAKDIVTLYPDMPEADPARRFIEEVSKSQRAESKGEAAST